MRADGVTRESSGLAIRAQTRAARRQRGIAAEAARRVQWGRWTGFVVLWQFVSWLGAAIITSLVGFSWIAFGFFVIVVSVSCLPLFTHVLARPGWLLERQARAGDDVALAVGHLPPRLARLAQETRVLRLAIEAATPGEPAIDDWVWVWVSAVRELGPAEREVIDRLAVSPRDVVAVLLGEALGERESVADLAAARGETIDEAAQVRRVELLSEHLEAFEVALLRYDPDPYRGS